MDFKLNAPYRPMGDQPEAIRQLVEGIQKGYKNQVLLGATGTGKTFTIASVIEQVQRPTLVMAHNKTLAAQLYAEFKEFFPENGVEYFVSYYDYYQPEAYVPRYDLYIEKESDINEEIERLRLAATTSLMSRKDVIIVASVSCIYGLGNPESYGLGVINLEKGKIYRRNALLRQLVESQYERNDIELSPGTFRVRGDSLDIIPAYQDRSGFRITFFGDEVEKIIEFDSLTGELMHDLSSTVIYPAKHFITEESKLKSAIHDIEDELFQSLKYFKENGKLLEAQRLEQRTLYDLEMLREIGYCSGIENYSRHLDQRPVGSSPWTLMDYLPSDYILVMDESHMSIPQVRGMYNGDRSRKQVLVEYGFRLPSALDNRPLTFDEFGKRMGYTIYTSATPAPFELQRADQVVEQIIRPTGLVDPEVQVRPVEGQIDDLIDEIRQRVERAERTLVTTLTKRMAEKLADYLLELGIKVHYLHSEIDTLERVGILRDLRLGVFDVIVGINLLREGLDLPEVSLVAILDADKEGFLRSGTALIQTIGRAARNVNGKVIMYADKMTDSMARAIDETNRRREKQVSYNTEHGIEPVSIHKAVRDLTDQLTIKVISEPQADYAARSHAALPKNEITKVITELEKQMKDAARNLEFEKAAVLRDQIYELRAMLADQSNIKPWEKVHLLAGEEEFPYELEPTLPRNQEGGIPLDIEFSKARPADASILAQVSERAFNDDINHGAPGIGGPPGYKSSMWQSKMIGAGDYYKILMGSQIIGGILVFSKSRGHYELGRIFLDPEFQNQGIGTQAMEFLWQEYPMARKWTLGTPAWNMRNRHFYQKVGFIETGEDGRGGILFVRTVP
jgi:excinuclease ABC subunit B